MTEIKGKILIVDDNLMNLELLEETLDPFGYEILSYTNPIEALKNEEDSKIDLALIDVVMPEINGFSFAEKFSISHPHTPIAYVSAHNSNENKIKGYNMGSCVYIEKPYDVKTLRAQIQSILNLKAVQDELRLEKEKLDYIFEFSSNEIILTDLNFNIVSQNNKILPKQKNKTNILDLVLAHAGEDYCDRIKAFLNSEENHLRLNFIIDGKKHIKASFSKIKPNNRNIGFLVMLEDITKEFETEKLRNNFIDILNHHLKTPVRAEKRALQLLMENSFGALSLEQKDIVGEILNSTRCMLHMMDNILTRYKLDNGQFVINKTSNSINKSIQSCLENLNYLFKSRKQTVKINSFIEKDENYIFEYDEKEIKRALTNLIYNASEYSPISSEINIYIKRNDKNIEITVKDEGMGIPEEIMKSTIDETYNGQKFKKVGAGQGLYITKKIIEAHNGKFQIASSSVESSQFKLDKGTSFTFFLPCIKTVPANFVQS